MPTYPPSSDPIFRKLELLEEKMNSLASRDEARALSRSVEKLREEIAGVHSRSLRFYLRHPRKAIARLAGKTSEPAARRHSSKLIAERPTDHVAKATPARESAPASEWQLGMTTLAEQKYYERHAREIYTGRGAIVDLGCWLGSASIPLARGLMKNPRVSPEKTRIFAFDRFEWEASMDDGVAGSDLVGVFQPGESFLPELRRRLGEYRRIVVAERIDLTRTGWYGGEIELLLVDAMKNWELTNSIALRFFPCLIPGASYVVHRDFTRGFAPWIHLLMYALRDCFDLVTDLSACGTTVFKCVREIPSGLLERGIAFERFGREDIDRAFDPTDRIEDPVNIGNLAAAHVYLYLERGERDVARKTFESYLARGIPLQNDFFRMKNLLESGAAATKL